MSRVITFATAVAALIKAKVPGLAETGWQLGPFNLDELQRTTRRAPFVMVGVLAAPVERSNDGNVSARCQVAAFVVTKGQEAARDAQAWTIGEAIAVLAGAETQMWGIVGLGIPERVQIEPLTSVGLDKQGVTLLAVQWTQKLHRIGEGVFDADPDAPERLFIFDEEQETGTGAEDGDAPPVE